MQVTPHKGWQLGSLKQLKQESLANSKVSAQQPGYIGRKSLISPT